MAAILASQGCYCRKFKSFELRTSIDELGSSCSISVRRLPKFEEHTCNVSAFSKGFGFWVEMRQTKDTSEVMKTVRNPSVEKARRVNGTKQNINGVNIITKNNTTSFVKKSRVLVDEGLPPLEEPRVMPSDAGFSWANDSYISVQRSAYVWSFVLSLRVRILLENAKWAYIGGFDEEKQKKRRKRTASWLRERVLQLGPTFIKIGQLSSARSDLFPREYVDELAKLQDRVPAFSSTKAKELISAELGAPVDILFREFEDQPIAAASIGQEI